jgi:hypothetical protein
MLVFIRKLLNDFVKEGLVPLVLALWDSKLLKALSREGYCPLEDDTQEFELFLKF